MRHERDRRRCWIKSQDGLLGCFVEVGAEDVGATHKRLRMPTTNGCTKRSALSEDRVKRARRLRQSYKHAGAAAKMSERVKQENERQQLPITTGRT